MEVSGKGASPFLSLRPAGTGSPPSPFLGQKSVQKRKTEEDNAIPSLEEERMGEMILCSVFENG